MDKTKKLVFYIEDDDNDVFLMQRAFGKLDLPVSLRVVSDGALAIAYLSTAEPFGDVAENPIPNVILLDLSMPGKHGLDVLKWIRSRPNLSKIPVIVLTSSNQETDIHRSYLLGANGFVVKPGDPAALARIVTAIHDYWVSENPPPGPFVDLASIPRPERASSNSQ